MSYRGKYQSGDKMKDVFDSTNYRILRDRFVTVNFSAIFATLRSDSLPMGSPRSSAERRPVGQSFSLTTTSLRKSDFI
jgi:hypothetical protein